MKLITNGTLIATTINPTSDKILTSLTLSSLEILLSRTIVDVGSTESSCAYKGDVISEKTIIVDIT